MQAKKNILIVAMLLLFGNMTAWAQQTELTGKVLDASTGMAVEFANLGITGTFKGDATDEDGVFNIRFDSKLKENNLRVSAVGYETREFRISQLLKSKPLVIRLQPIVYGIDEVDVQAPSRILYGMLKDALRNLQKNYMAEAYSAKMKYTEHIGTKTRNLTLDYADLAGYQDRTRESAFLDRNYKIVSGVRNYDINPFSKGLHRIEELLGFDYLRHPGNVLDSSFVDHFSVSEKDNYLKNGNRVIVIAFESQNPKFAYSGDAQIKSLQGEIHLNRDNLSVLEISAVYQSHGRFRHGRSFFVNNELAGANDEGDVKYSVDVVYEDINKQKKALKSVRVAVNKDNATTETSSYELIFTDFSIGQEILSKKGRQYYDNVSKYSSEM